MKKKILTFVGIVLAFLALSYGFVPEVLGGKVVNQSDITGFIGMSHEMSEWNSAHPDDRTGWTDSMFGGMPTVTFDSFREGDFTQPVYDLLLTGRRPATYLFISLLGAFLLMLSLGMSPLVAFGGAIAVTFCSYNMQIIQVGHNTKMQALAFLPWVLAAVIHTYRKAVESKGGWLVPALLGAALFGIALSFQVKANHPQITYYLAIIIFVYAIVTFVSVLGDKEKKEKLKRFAAASALLLVMGLLGVATNANKLLPLYEYTPNTIRGGSASADGGKGTGGLDLDYATYWSYGWEELPNLVIPNFNGGSSAGPVDPGKSATCDFLKKNYHYGSKDIKEVSKALPMYWGSQPFTAGPMYIGAVTFFLFVLGLFLCDRKDKWWIAVSTMLAILMAVGYHLLWFTKFWSDYMPMYNKFRTVSMALVTLQFTLPVLGFLALDKVLRMRWTMKEFISRAWVPLAISAGFCLVCVLLQNISGPFNTAGELAEGNPLYDAFAADRRMLRDTDLIRTLILIVSTFAIIAWGCSGNSKASAARGSSNGSGKDGADSGRTRHIVSTALVCALVMFDLFATGKRYLNSSHFVTPKEFNGQFDKTEADKFILEDSDPSYRVLDLTASTFNSSKASYWHKSVGGYSPAKLSIFEDFRKSTLDREIAAIQARMKDAKGYGDIEEVVNSCKGLALLNCRYVIIHPDLPPAINAGALGEAWFEDAEGSVSMTSYAPNELRYRCSSEKGGKVVFSEIYYPDGWTLRLEDSGEVLAIGKAHDLLRSAEVPAGDHDIVMRFEQPGYAAGRAVSESSSVILLLATLLAAALSAFRKKEGPAIS